MTMKLRRRVVATGFKTFEFETKLTESERSRRAWMRVTGRGELNWKVSPRDEKESRKAPVGHSVGGEKLRLGNLPRGLNRS
uniref:Uncharacterized protein n=1 Tax=Nelumbo nucifera TaxID=4432 RepID=A0A822XQB1_NELNU|nr:TPA_asm: hypothetical protein HUJ06_023685 [Nelumbo nucifera]